MRKLSLLLIISASLLTFTCKKDNKSERFTNLTSTVWTSDSLKANGVEAGNPGEFLANFNGDAEFYEDGTGYFGIYTGEWRFNTTETEITIITTEMPLPIVCNIVQLTSSSLKVTTVVPDPVNTSEIVNVRMAFKPK
jgi:hypothetical protein